MAINRRPQSANRRINRKAKAKLKEVQLKRDSLTEKLKGKINDPFRETFIFRSFLFGMISFQKSGLVLAPTRTWKIGNIMIRKTVDTLVLAGFGYVFKAIDWRIRQKSKPKEAKGNYIFKLNKFISNEKTRGK